MTNLPGNISQSNFDFEVERPHWAAMGLLLGEIEDETARRQDKIIFTMSAWLLGVMIFQKFQAQFMEGELNQLDASNHRVSLARLLALGEKILSALERHSDVDPETAGISFEDVAATVEQLRVGWRVWYGDMKPERREEILREVFGGEE